MRTLTFDVYEDPGHGWVKVSFARLVRIVGPNWRSLFTPYSFERGSHAFLEEDCDATRLIQFCRATGIEPRWRMHRAQRESRIRDYDSLRTETPTPLRQTP